MRDVYILNLKDNRGKGENKNNDIKFNLCFTNSIIAIGWVGYTLHSGSVNYDNAKETFDNIETDDLVWVRNPKTKKYYICEVVKDKENINHLKAHLNANDISNHKFVDFYEVGPKECLPDEITYRNLISRRTVRRVNNSTVIKATNDKFNSLRGNKID